MYLPVRVDVDEVFEAGFPRSNIWSWIRSVSGTSSYEFLLPSGELTFGHGKSQFLMGKSTISMAMFHCFLYVHQAGSSPSIYDCWMVLRKTELPFLCKDSFEMDGENCMTSIYIYIYNTWILIGY